MNNYIIIVLFVVGMMTTPQAFAVTSVFDIDVRDSDSTHNYKVCITSEGFIPSPEECLDFKGSEFSGYVASFEYEDVNIGEGFDIYVEDITSHVLVKKHLTIQKRIRIT